MENEPKPPAPTDTPEQTEIKAIRSGFHVVSANAGTGKTHTLAHLIVGLYLEEMQKIEADHRDLPLPPVTLQKQILKQIVAITFTRDAAKELDDRIWAGLAERGITELKNAWGKRHRICRTIDSYVRDWMRRPMVIRKLLRVDPDILGSLNEKLGKLSPVVRESLKIEVRKEGKSTGRSADPEIGLFREWPWLRKDRVSDLIFDTIHRGSEDRITGTKFEGWAAEFDQYLAALQPPPAKVEQREGGDFPLQWASDFWDEKMGIWNDHQQSMRGLNDQNKRGELAGKPSYQDHHLALKVWEKHEGARKEFFAILEIARSRGYHPVRSPKKLAAIPVLQELAASEHWDDFIHFHDFSLQFYAQKMNFGVMDFADFLIACVDTFEQYPDLVERDVEYPKWGIRTKYVLYDEVQDNSISNNRLFKVLCGTSTVPYLGVAVGDAKQAIYGFRGACSYGFGQMIEAVQKRKPENIHHLTCSFRSLSKIVDLGNECVLTLPEYKAGVHPSHTVYTDPGEIVIAPPLKDEGDETDWVVHRIREILDETADTVMVLHRNNLREHPIVPSLKEFAEAYPGRLSVLTIHRSKGLQAHHVFLMGMTATLMPDVRTSYTQMVNLLYVGLTRPRKALYITAPYTLLKTNSSGEVEIKDVGPSPFLFNIPSLREAAEQAGWPLDMLMKGEETTERAAGNLSARIGGKDAYLRSQWKRLWRDVPIQDDDGDEYTPETGGAAADDRVKRISRRTLYEDGKIVLKSAPKLDEGIRERVIDALRKAYPKNGQAPRFGRDEYILALKAGWISKVEGSRHSEITPRFLEQCAPHLILTTHFEAP